MTTTFKAVKVGALYDQVTVFTGTEPVARAYAAGLIRQIAETETGEERRTTEGIADRMADPDSGTTGFGVRGVTVDLTDAEPVRQFDVLINGLIVRTAPEPDARAYAADVFRQAIARYPVATRRQRAAGCVDAIGAGECVASWLERGVVSGANTSHSDPYPHRTVIEVRETSL